LKEGQKMDGIPIVILVLACVALFILAQFITGRMTRRAAFRVIEIFREHKAVGIHQAKTIDELGLRPPGLIERFGRMRDYKRTALNLLVKAEAIRMTQDGKLYIPEEKYEELMRKGTLRQG
jgi:hypothetical protein